MAARRADDHQELAAAQDHVNGLQGGHHARRRAPALRRQHGVAAAEAGRACAGSNVVASPQGTYSLLRNRALVIAMAGFRIMYS